jgi:hypothetical protein
MTQVVATNRLSILSTLVDLSSIERVLMIKLKSIILALSLILAFASLSSAAGNPALLIDKGKFSFGLRAIYLDEMELKDYDMKRSPSDGPTVMERKSASFKSDNTFLADITYGANDWLNLVASLGLATDGVWRDTDKASGDLWKARMDSVFLWGLGAKARLYKADNGITILAEANYLRYDDRKINDWKNTTGNYDAEEYWATDDNLDYWQMDLMVTGSWKLGDFTPYLGLGYSYGEAKFSGNWRSQQYPAQPISYNYEATMKMKTNFKALLGCQLKVVEGFNITAEVSLFSQTAFSFGLSWEF